MTRSVLVSVTAALTLALPATVHALPLDEALGCGHRAHDYISSLQARQLIPAHPLHVEDNAINVFWPANHADLTAFGFSVYVVIGYEQDDPIFKVGSGTPLRGSLYGVVVSGSPADITKAIGDAHSPAQTKHAGPFLTAIYCRAE
jgi:hypothetical protein